MKQIFRYLYTLIRVNPAKMVFLILAPLCFYMAHTSPDTLNRDRFINQFTTGGEYNFVVTTTGKSPYTVETFDKKPPNIITEYSIQYIEYYDTSGATFVFYTIFALLSLMILIATFIDDDETNWGFDIVYQKMMVEDVRCDSESGKEFYYHLHGKLLSRSERMLEPYHIQGFVRDYINNKNLYPKYEGTISDRRAKKLENIGV